MHVTPREIRRRDGTCLVLESNLSIELFDAEGRSVQRWDVNDEDWPAQAKRFRLAQPELRRYLGDPKDW